MVLVTRAAHRGDHCGARVAAQAVLEQARELRVAIGYVGHAFLVLLPQCVDAVGERQQRAVDVGAVVERLAAVVGLRRALGTGQVHQRQLAVQHLRAVLVRLGARDADGENRMRAARRGVGIGGLGLAPRVSLAEQIQDGLSAVNIHLGDACDGDALPGVFAQLQRVLFARVRIEQIVYELIVHFDVRALHIPLVPAGRVRELSEDVLERQHHQARVIVRAHHGVCLARARRAVREDGRVQTVEDRASLLGDRPLVAVRIGAGALHRDVEDVAPLHGALGVQVILFLADRVRGVQHDHDLFVDHLRWRRETTPRARGERAARDAGVGHRERRESVHGGRQHRRLSARGVREGARRMATPRVPM